MAKVYDQIRERVKTAAVRMAEAFMGEVSFSGNTVDPARYMIYLAMPAKVADVLTNHYAKTRTHSASIPYIGNSGCHRISNVSRSMIP